MARVILGVTGSVAAIRTSELYRTFRSEGHDVRVIATNPSLHFFDPAEIAPPLGEEPVVFRDADEWPSERYRRGDLVPHIAFRSWAELLVVAPLDANSLAKFALGLCDNFLTCLFRAWDFSKPVVLAPAMNTHMWESPITRRHLRSLLADFGDPGAPTNWELSQAAAVFEKHGRSIRIAGPVEKTLACGDVGVGAMAEPLAIASLARGLLGG